MEIWQLYQKHNEDVGKVLREGGEMDSNGRLRLWRGKLSLAKIEALGHNSVGFEQCSCRLEKKR